MLLIISSLPLMILCFLLGGILLSEIARAYLILILAAGTFGLISVACSSFFGRTSSALVVSYLVILPLALVTVTVTQAPDVVLRDFVSIAVLPPWCLAIWVIVGLLPAVSLGYLSTAAIGVASALMLVVLRSLLPLLEPRRVISDNILVLGREDLARTLCGALDGSVPLQRSVAGGSGDATGTDLHLDAEGLKSLVRTAGISRIVVVGVCMEPDTIYPMLGISKELNLQFVLGYTPDEFAATLGHIAEGRISTAPLITGRVGLEGVAGAFEALASPERHAKILVEPWRA